MHPTRLFLTGPLNAGRDALNAAALALIAAGYAVATPGHVEGCADVDTLAAILGADLDALAQAAAVVALPGSDDLPDVEVADLFGVPVVTLPGALAGAVTR